MFLWNKCQLRSFNTKYPHPHPCTMHALLYFDFWIVAIARSSSLFSLLFFHCVLFYHAQTGLVPEICFGRTLKMPICPNPRCSCKIRYISFFFIFIFLYSIVFSLCSMYTSTVLYSLCATMRTTRCSIRLSSFGLPTPPSTANVYPGKWLCTPHVEEWGV